MFVRMNTNARTNSDAGRLRVGMVGMGMIFDETYRPFLETAARDGVFDPAIGRLGIELTAVASRTGSRAETYRNNAPSGQTAFLSCVEPNAVDQLLESDVDLVCVASPDDRHFEAARAVIEAGKHVLIEKPSVLSLAELDMLVDLANQRGVLAKVVYHKLFDPDHKKLRTLVVDDVLQHVNSGYCTLLEPKQISGSQFAEWITGRNPGTYVAVHYIKLIDFTFGGRLLSVSCTGQRGIVGPADGDTWDSTQLRMVYGYGDQREAAFDIHTSWVTPDNFPGYVEQEVQFRFDNGVWNGHSRRRGVECTVGYEDLDEQPLQRDVCRTFWTSVATRVWVGGAGTFYSRSSPRRVRRRCDGSDDTSAANACFGVQRSGGRSTGGGDCTGDGRDSQTSRRRCAELYRRSECGTGWAGLARPRFESTRSAIPTSGQSGPPVRSVMFFCGWFVLVGANLREPIGYVTHRRHAQQRCSQYGGFVSRRLVA